MLILQHEKNDFMLGGIPKPFTHFKRSEPVSYTKKGQMGLYGWGGEYEDRF
jgi:hypothetical protein